MTSLRPSNSSPFTGFLAVPAIPYQQDEHWHRVGLVTIQLLGLNREGLRKERAGVLWKMFPVLEMLYQRLAEPSAESSRHHGTERKALAGFTDASVAHASCARAFEALHRRDPEQARLWYEGARRYLKRFGRY